MLEHVKKKKKWSSRAQRERKRKPEILTVLLRFYQFIAIALTKHAAQVKSHSHIKRSFTAI